MNTMPQKQPVGSITQQNQQQLPPPAAVPMIYAVSNNPSNTWTPASNQINNNNTNVSGSQRVAQRSTIIYLTPDNQQLLRTIQAQISGLIALREPRSENKETALQKLILLQQQVIATGTPILNQNQLSNTNFRQNHVRLTSLSKGSKNAKIDPNQGQPNLNPLKMPHIVQHILSFLNVNSIKDARQANKLWSFEGAKLLIDKCYVLLSPELRVQVQKSSRQSLNEMDKFLAFLSHKSQQPLMIPNIKIEDPLDVELLTAFGVLGPEVNSLKLEVLGGDNAQLLSNLLNLLPNLKYLNIHRKYYYSYDNFFHRKNGPIVQVLASAMLKRNKDGNENPLTVSCLDLKLETEEELENIEKLADLKNIILKELVLLNVAQWPESLAFVSNIEDRVVNFMSKFLTAGQNPLKNLSVFYDLSNQGVEEMNFAYGPVSQIYPRSDDLIAYQVRFSQKMLNCIWEHGKGLKKLKLSVHLDQLIQDVADLDCAFTGFTPQTVNKMRKLQKLIPYTGDELEKLRVGPSLLDLKELEVLIIRFDETLNCIPVPYPRKRLLAIAAEYAFRFMPRTRIFIKVQDNGQELKNARLALNNFPSLRNVVLKFKDIDKDISKQLGLQ